MANNSFSFDVSVRYFDIDTNNHVNNSVYFTYMEEARIHLLQNQLLECADKGISFVVAETQCKYKRPIRLQDKVSIKIVVESITGISFTLIYKFVDASDQLYAEGSTRIACIDMETQKLRRLPQEIIDYLEVLA